MDIDLFKQQLLECLPVSLNEETTEQLVPRIVALVRHLVEIERQDAVDSAAVGWGHAREAAEKSARAEAIADAVERIVKWQQNSSTDTEDRMLRTIARQVRALTNKEEPESERVEREQLFGGEYFSA